MIKNTNKRGKENKPWRINTIMRLKQKPKRMTNTESEKTKLMTSKTITRKKQKPKPHDKTKHTWKNTTI